MADRCRELRSCRHGSRTTAWRAAFVVFVGAATAACGSASKPTPGATSTTAPGGFAPDAVIAQVSVGGGFIDPRGAVRLVPSVTVLGDGSVITPGAVAAIYPGPAIVPLQVGHISPARIHQLLADARRLGLLARTLDFGRPGIADAGTTTVRIGDGTRALAVQSAYALGDGTSDAGLTAPQRAARHALQSFVNELQSLPVGDRTFRPRAVAVFTFTAAVTSPAEPAKRWPIATLPAPVGRSGLGCVVVTGAMVVPLLAALAQANENTPWEVGARTLSLSFRPLVPGDAGCTT